jgi:hypothetical protein
VYFTGQVQIALTVLHFLNNDKLETFEGNKKLVKSVQTLKHLNKLSIFSSLYRLKENIYILMMVMEGQMGSEQYIPLKTGKFIMK